MHLLGCVGQRRRSPVILTTAVYFTIKENTLAPPFLFKTTANKLEYNTAITDGTFIQVFVSWQKCMIVLEALIMPKNSV